MDKPVKTERKGVGAFSAWMYRHLNFFRIHLLVFTFFPLVFAAILYASKNQNYVSYTDALFICVSSATMAGLSTIDLSLLTAWQQFLTFILMLLGSPIAVSWVVVLIRRHFLAKELHSRLTARGKLIEEERKTNPELDSRTHKKWWRSPISTLLHRSNTLHAETNDETDPNRSSKKHKNRRVRPHMIHRIDEKPKLINPSGLVNQDRMPIAQTGLLGSQSTRPRPPIIEQPPTDSTFSQSPEHTHSQPSVQQSKDSDAESGSELEDLSEVPRRGRCGREALSSLSPPPPNHSFSHPSQPRGPSVTRTQTVEFAPSPQLKGRHQAKPSVDESRISSGEGHVRAAGSAASVQHETGHPHRPSAPAIQRGLGGFPMPHEIISSFIHRFFPNLERGIKRTMTIPVSQTLTSQQHVEGGQQAAGSRPVNYITFNATIGRNSTFRDLTSEQIEELCGIEFKALNCLAWIVPCYYAVNQVFWFVILAPYMSLPRWRQSFIPPNLHSTTSPVWFSLYQVVSAFSNTGLSLVDQSVVPFQRAYPMVVALTILIIAGNTGYPIFLRFTIWLLMKLIPARFGLKEPLTFLLDHPRRCFVSLFPSHQTWFLFSVVLGLTCVDWFFFLVLDIGTSAIESIPLGERVLVGLMQASAVRTAGFAIVPMALLAPGVKVLYVVTMYVSAYPIAMSVRSTNVYEENSLGIFEDEVGPVDEGFTPIGPTASVWGRYLALHMRKQLSFDMWWLALALFLVCIVERPDLTDPENATWFNIFAILFEVVSAYGTVGLSLGIPTQNYSLSGAFHPLSKLIICAVMLRGRHRGLPVAIDRAVMLPELNLDDEMTLQRRMSHNANHTYLTAHSGDGTSLRPTPTIQTLSVRGGV